MPEGWNIDVSGDEPMEELLGDPNAVALSSPYYTLTISYDGELVFEIKGRQFEMKPHLIQKLNQDLQAVDRIRKIERSPMAHRLRLWWETFMPGFFGPHAVKGKHLPYEEIIALLLDVVHEEDEEDPQTKLINRLALGFQRELQGIFGSSVEAFRHWTRGAVAKAGIYPIQSMAEISDRAAEGKALYALDEQEG